MSDVEDSAIDAMVDEVMEGREAKESAVDPQPAAPIEQVVAEEVVEPKPKGKGKRPSLGFAGSADDGDDAEDAGDAESGDADDLETVRAERDSYLADSQRLAADFANYRKQSDKRVADAAATQSAGLVRDLILVLDACDAALVQDTESAAGPIRSQLISELTKNGLELLAPVEDEVFDPEQHEAVMHEPAPEDSEHDGPVIGDVLRAGYTWKGRVVRPAMVKVVG